MAESIAIINQKGGCGKTTTTVNLSSALALMGKNILVVDMDPQGNLTSSFNIDKTQLTKTSYTVITGQTSIKESIIPTEINNLYILPTNIALSGAEVELSNEKNYYNFLKAELEEIKTMFDYILIDVPPSLGILTLNAIIASDSIIIPIQAEYYALEGMADLINTVKLVEERLKSPAPIKGVLLTLYDSRTRLGRDVYQEIKNFFKNKEKVFKTVIPRNIKLAEAPSFSQSCIQYDIECTGSQAYISLAKEIIKMDKKQ